ncbi:MAG: type IX secretion system membrane protein PorP/SprF [Bacteroidales bacterium]|nr:type IX secretion system membrane protein PorP/SprF [Bacteroidales bacterium]HNW74392.1 type IX secretion system membrane protein PorP/SprF [Bacteroidales bacterium]HPS50938.1 type IX secretion system membrane protein PorP/SprF [Bacteroidales bacterium]
MSRRNQVLVVILLFQSFRGVMAQDPEFSQFYANPLYLNPALTGLNICPRAIGNYRNQWPGLGKAFNTYNVSYDQYVTFLHGGIGVLLTADRAGGGNLNTTVISLMYAYKFNITSRLQASGAIKAGYYQRRLVWENLTFEDMIDPQGGFILPTSEKQPDQPRIGVPDFSAGIFLAYDNLVYGGVAVDHLSQPKIGFYANNDSPLYMKFTIHAGGTINLRKNGSAEDEREFSLSPNVLYQQQFKYHQLNIGLYLTIDPFVGGVWYRHSFENPDAIIPMLGIHYKNLQVGYSYDFTISNLKGASGGAHEVSASWQFPCSEKRRHIRAIKCPRF